jgi:hypothetical protein
LDCQDKAVALGDTSRDGKAETAPFGSPGPSIEPIEYARSRPIDHGYAPAPNDAKDQLRAADESEGLSDHRVASASVRQRPTRRISMKYFNEWSFSALGEVA